MKVKIDIIAEEKIAAMKEQERIRFVLDGVKSGNIVVLEGGLTPDEQMKLIEVTMTEINEDFTGIEIGGDSRKKSFLRLRKKSRPTVIGPAKVMETIKKDKHSISAVISVI